MRPLAQSPAEGQRVSPSTSTRRSTSRCRWCFVRLRCDLAIKNTRAADNVFLHPVALIPLVWLLLGSIPGVGLPHPPWQGPCCVACCQSNCRWRITPVRHADGRRWAVGLDGPRFTGNTGLADVAGDYLHRRRLPACPSSAALCPFSLWIATLDFSRAPLPWRGVGPADAGGGSV